MLWARSYRIFSYNLSRSGTSSGDVPLGNTIDSVAPSSMAWPAPCPWSGYMSALESFWQGSSCRIHLRGVKGWAASPSSASFPDTQVGSFSMSSNCHTLMEAGSTFLIRASRAGSKS